MSATGMDLAAGAAGEDPDFGTLTVPESPAGVAEPRSKFRIAVLGDFSGRANRGALEVGEGLSARKPWKLDVDTLDDVIARFRTRLALPIGPEGAAVEVDLGAIDDLHPDELYDAVEVFSELQNLRRLVTSGRAERAMADLQSWGAEFGELKAIARRRARGAQVPADLRLSDFAQLIGAGAEARPEPTPTDELIRRVVAPYVVKAPDPDLPAMQAAVDAALSGAMRALLHNPDFQAVESAWRSLDLLARRIETGGGLELVVYDVAAEEFAVDLASSDELSDSALFQMLAEKPGLDAAQGRLAAVIGLYQFEETPPHASLLGRMARIAAYMDAPFVASVNARFLDTKTDDLHPLVADAFAKLKALPEAAYLGLAAPRFLLRQPYGARSDPIDPFDFEEFTRQEGLKGMLWANPAVLVATLLGASWVQGGGKVALGSVMTLDDIPFYYVTDEHGDQVALPCTERLLTERSVAEATRRGYMPVLSIAGRNEVRLGAFRAITGEELAGPWAENAVGGPEAMRRRSAEPAVAAVASAGAAPSGAGSGEIAAPDAAPGTDDVEDEPLLPGEEGDDLDALLAALEEEADAEPEPEPDGPDEDMADLDALLATLEAPAEEAAAEVEDELDALLASLGSDDAAPAGAPEAEDAAGEPEAAPEPEPEPEAELDELDALLASFGDDAAAGSGDDDAVDDELDALLKDL